LGFPKIDNALLPRFSTHKDVSLPFPWRGLKLKTKIKETIDELKNKNFANSSLSDDFKNEVELIIDSRLNELSPEQVKFIIKDIIHKHLGWLVVWGGVFGFLIGLILGFLGGLS